MANAVKKPKLAATGDELGEQLLQSVREMKAGLRGRVHPSGASPSKPFRPDREEGQALDWIQL